MPNKSQVVTRGSFGICHSRTPCKTEDLDETLSIQQGHLSFWQNRDGIPRMNGLDNGQTKYYLRPKIEGVVAFKKCIKKNDVLCHSIP